MQKVCYDVEIINKLLGFINNMTPVGINQCRDLVTVYDTLKEKGELVTFTTDEQESEPMIPTQEPEMESDTEVEPEVEE